MTIKQAIKGLSKLDKRWVDNKEWGFVRDSKSNKKLGYFSDDYNDIEAYHAAAKALGYEIWWEYCEYNNMYASRWDNQSGSVKCFKTPTKAIQAAFIWCVEQKLKEGK